MRVKELVSKLPELGKALERIFKDGAVFDSRYPVISYTGDLQVEKDQQSAEIDDTKISQT
ncbi:MAG TPA: hypothetical protein PKJ26_02645 [Candidatus Woesebacteria bacterium]|nr:hypothetical protein [Candidatus Woesebacteria bacterium]HNS65372.1 hypothetical protein [Candidatus Woesebacteria bacterium]